MGHRTATVLGADLDLPWSYVPRGASRIGTTIIPGQFTTAKVAGKDRDWVLNQGAAIARKLGPSWRTGRVEGEIVREAKGKTPAKTDAVELHFWIGPTTAVRCGGAIRIIEGG